MESVKCLLEEADFAIDTVDDEDGCLEYSRYRKTSIP